MRSDPFTTLRRPLLAALLVCSTGFSLTPLVAEAALDLLKVPARPSSLATKSMLLAVASAGDRLVAAGERGVIIYSDDQGTSWSQGRVPVSVTLTSLWFSSRDVGWAAGHDGVILGTIDGGKSWNKLFDGNVANTLVMSDLESQLKRVQASRDKADAKSMATLEAIQASLEDVKAGAEFGPSRPLFGLWFRDAFEGFAVGSFGQLFRTGDGGKTWESWGAKIANPEGFHYNAISRLADGSLMIAGEAGKLRRSRDDGANWETLDTGYPGHLYGALAIPGSTVLLAYGFGGNTLRSVDDGNTWKVLPKLTGKPIIGSTILPDGTVLLLTRDRWLLASSDQGQSFLLKKTQSDLPVAAMLPALYKANTLAVAGVGGVSLIAIETAR